MFLVQADVDLDLNLNEVGARLPLSWRSVGNLAFTSALCRLRRYSFEHVGLQGVGREHRALRGGRRWRLVRRLHRPVGART